MMKKTTKFILLCILFTSSLSLNGICTRNISTLAYFSDSDYDTGNMLTAGIWGSEADSLEITDSKVWPNRKPSSYKPSLELEVTGFRNVTIDKIQVSWINSSKDRCITKIGIESDDDFFNGSELSGDIRLSGDIIDGTNYLLMKDSYPTISFYFNNTVSDNLPFTVNITMGDGSTVENYTATL